MPDPVASSSDSELRAHVERILSAHYELDCEIGRGGMGIVYRAKDKRLKRVVAIKVLPPELAFRGEIRSRFLREAETAASLGHPNIVPIFSVDEVESLVFFVMAYVAGDNLAKRQHDLGVLGADDVRRILCEVSDALDFAHERGVVHRDIKPDNILLDAESGRAMVTDFGIARAITEGGDSRLTATGMAIGTPAYMSPEQAAGEREIDGRSDLYSLGVVAYQMLVGEPPFTASSTPAMLVKVISERPIPVDHRRTDLPPDLARAIMMCLEKEPANRFPTAGALAEALARGTTPAFGALPSPHLPAPRDRQSRDTIRAPDTYDEIGRPYTVPLYLRADEAARYNAKPVVEFRKKLGPYLFVNAVILLAAIFVETDFLTVTVLWSIYIAYRYAKLWGEDGYDWRDVFRQPRDKELIDVADEAAETMRTVFDREKRQQLRAQRREQRALIERQPMSQEVPTRLPRLSGQSPSERVSRAAPAPPFAAPSRAQPQPWQGSPPPQSETSRRPLDSLDQTARERIRRVKADCDQVLARWHGMSKTQREMLPPETPASAIGLAEKVRQLSVLLSDIDRAVGSGALQRVEEEIDRLHGEANPLREAESETRVRRLVSLKRERRALAEQSSRRAEVADKIESCVEALAAMRTKLDLMAVGTESPQNVTQLIRGAMSLADHVDDALFVAAEMNRIGGEPAGSGRPPVGS